MSRRKLLLVLLPSSGAHHAENACGMGGSVSRLLGAPGSRQAEVRTSALPCNISVAFNHPSEAKQYKESVQGLVDGVPSCQVDVTQLTEPQPCSFLLYAVFEPTSRLLSVNNQRYSSFAALAGAPSVSCVHTGMPA